MSQEIYNQIQLFCLFLFLLVFIGRTVYLHIRNNIRVFALGSGKGGLQRFVELFFFVLLVAWLIEVFLYTQPWNICLFPYPLSIVLFDSEIIKFTGLILIITGQIIFLMALYAFGDSWRVGVDKKTPDKLVTNGIFSISRNPIFLFLDLYFIGTFLINGTLIFLLFSTVIIAGMHYQILQEERFLLQKYGMVYQRY